MEESIKVAIVGLGRVGSTFLQKLLEFNDRGVSIVAAAEKDPGAPGVQIARDNGINVYNDADKIVDMGADVDVIFELTGSADARKGLREAMVRTGNTSTVIAPEIMAFLIWNVISEEGALPDVRSTKGY